MPGAKTARTCSLSPRPESIGDPISNSGLEFSANFLHLFRQSALSKSHFVTSSGFGPPRQRLSASECSEILSTCPPTPPQCQLSFHCCCYCCYCCPWLEALLDAPCTSLALPVVRGIICHFGLLVQTPFFKWWWFNWRWRWRRRQRRTAATATPFPVVT